MKKAVLDASALLAFAKQEEGSTEVERWMFDSCLSSVNYAEVLQKAGQDADDRSMLEAIVQNFRIEVVGFTATHANRVADYFAQAHRGISLADRACLATASLLGLPAITGDRAWLDLEFDVKIQCFRSNLN